MEFIIYPIKNPVAFNLFNFPIRYYGIIMALSFFVGIFFTYFLIQKKYSKTESEIFLDFIPYNVIFAVIGARIFYVLGNFSFYSHYPKEIFLINHGGLSIWGGILFSIPLFIYFTKKYKLDTLKFLDITSITLPMCQSIGRWGNYFNQEAYGAPYNGFLKLFVDYPYRKDGYYNYSYYHPAFLYESILDLLLFILLFVLFLKCKKLNKGTIFYLYLFFYSTIRIIVENLRIDSILDFYSIPIATIISLSILIFSGFMIIKNQRAN